MSRELLQVFDACFMLTDSSALQANAQHCPSFARSTKNCCELGCWLEDLSSNAAELTFEQRAKLKEEASLPTQESTGRPRVSSRAVNLL